MRIAIVKCGWVWILPPLIAGAAGSYCLFRTGHDISGFCLGGAGLIISLFMVYFHRNPDRIAPADKSAIVAGADGIIRRVESIKESEYLQDSCVRISIYLNPFNVHVNRAPIGGTVTKLGYTPGRHLLTINDNASEVNEHSSILIENSGIRCLVRQIVGPVVRRVVYWLKVDQTLKHGEVIGMMRFGSRLDMYLPESRVKVVVKKGDKVYAGETVVARIEDILQ